VLVNAVCYWAIGHGHWGFLASGTFFAAGGFAMISHAVGVSAQTVGVWLAVVGALGCLTVSRLTVRLGRFEPRSVEPGADPEAVMFENPFALNAAASGSATETQSAAEMPTAEEVWARVRSAALTRSALFAGLAATVVCGAATVLRAEMPVTWPALVFAAVCAATLALRARLPGSAVERAPLGVMALTLAVVLCAGAQNGALSMRWAGFAALLVIAVVAAAAGLGVHGRWLARRSTSVATYLEYATFAALIPVALWADGTLARLGIW
jgi:hypothetical protein